MTERLGHHHLPFPILGRELMLLALTWGAGTIDAISYLGLGHVFTAMMTGNTVLLGLALAEREALTVKNNGPDQATGVVVFLPFATICGLMSKT